jgi:hypothetical protein
VGSNNEIICLYKWQGRAKQWDIFKKNEGFRTRHIISDPLLLDTINNRIAYIQNIQNNFFVEIIELDNFSIIASQKLIEYNINSSVDSVSFSEDKFFLRFFEKENIILPLLKK